MFRVSETRRSAGSAISADFFWQRSRSGAQRNQIARNTERQLYVCLKVDANIEVRHKSHWTTSQLTKIPIQIDIDS